MKLQNRFLGNSSTRFIKYLVSYCTVTVLLISIASAIAYGSIYTSLNSQVENSNVSSIMQLRDIIDSRLREMERIAVQITSNHRLNASIIEIEGYDSLQVVKELQNYSSSSDFINDLILYYKHKHNDRIFASSGLYSLDDFFTREYDFKFYNTASFIEDANNVKAPVMKSVSPTARRYSSSKFKIYIYPIPANSSSPFGLVTFLIDDNKIISLLENVLSGRDGSVFIFDSNNQPIIGKGNDNDMLSIIEFINKVPDSGKVITADINNNKLSIVNAKSGYNGWKYVSAIKQDQFMEIAYKSSTVFNILIFILLFVGLFIAYFMATTNYKPIKLLTDKLKTQLNDKTQLYGNDEIAYITKTFEKIAGENAGLLNELQSVNYLIKENLLINLIMDKFENESEIEKHSILSGFNISDYKFVVLVFLMDDSAAFQSSSKSIQNLLRSSMVNTSEAFARQYGLGFGINLIESNGISLIFGVRKDDPNITIVEKLAISIKDYFKNNFNISMTTGVGNIYESIHNVSQSFAEASRAAAYRFIKGTDQILFYKDIDFSNKNTKYKYPVHLEARLLNSIKQGRRNDIDEIIPEILQSIKSQNISPEAVQCICFGIISTITKTLDDANFYAGSALDIEIVEIFTAKFDTIENLTAQMAVLCKNLCSHIKNQKESKNFALRDNIIEYVTKNYTKNTISLETIADKFGFSPSYITRYFKDQTGYSLMKFIDNLRLDKAKELLKLTDMTNKKIIEVIGYTDETNFIRKFKNYEGITPVQYRGLSRNSE